MILRVVLSEPDRLSSWPRVTHSISSVLVRLECLRTLDRARIRMGLSDEDLSVQRATVLSTLGAVNLMPLGPDILERASDPYPTLLGSLDAIHLATALAAREQVDDLVFATHDAQLALAARAMGFAVEGSAG